MVDGYEIHMGETVGNEPWLKITSRSNHPAHVPDGAASAGGRVWGCYLHGILANNSLRRAWLNSLDRQQDEDVASQDDLVDRSLDLIADVVEEALDIERLKKIVWKTKPPF